MKKNEELMRQWEQDVPVPPQNHIIVRIDGRHFHVLTRQMEKPFSELFRDCMVATTEHLVRDCGFNVVYGYTQSDEISLLLHRDDNTFNRKAYKIVSVLAGEASSCFSLKLGIQAAFDARLSVLPNAALVSDYFMWRQHDSVRNSLNAYTFWNLVKSGKSQRAASLQLMGMGHEQKHDFLMLQCGINWNETPAWHGAGWAWTG